MTLPARSGHSNHFGVSIFSAVAFFLCRALISTSKSLKRCPRSPPDIRNPFVRMASACERTLLWVAFAPGMATFTRAAI